ncbi:MAG TPA: PhnD/SsuA/transferrin family substrate-binding protein [Candidatus Nitrosopolaris sp.]|nr:PhnD/SsuA/transferrin family substrate-binding protein [Candidatus Nitrosopolaris sp.]
MGNTTGVQSSEGELVFATYLAPCLKPLYQLVTEAVGAELGRPTRLVDGRSFDQVRRHDVDFAFLCGLPYVRLRREDPSFVDAIAAPVVSGDRYAGRPIYFSDVIVPRDSEVTSWPDLRGRSWAYNEPDSHSGYLVTLARLAVLAETRAYFSRWDATGFHEQSIRQVAEGTVDATAIDSHVLAIALRDHPEHQDRVKVIDVLGPSTIQPLVATGGVPESLKRDVQRIVTDLATRPEHREQLTRSLVDEFVQVDDGSYADIRRMLAAAEAADLC